VFPITPAAAKRCRTTRASSTTPIAASAAAQREADFLVAVTLPRAADSSDTQQRTSSYAGTTTLPALAHCAVSIATPAALTAAANHKLSAEDCSDDMHDAIASYLDAKVACRPRSRLGMRRSTADTLATTATAAAAMAATASSTSSTGATAIGSSSQQRSASAPLSLCSAHTVWSDAQRAAAQESHAKVHYMSQHLHCKLALQASRRRSASGLAHSLAQQSPVLSKRERLVYTQQLHKWRWNDLLGIPKTRVYSAAERSSVAAAVLQAQAQCTQ
jgi:hypothetical protein